jgi:ribosome-associated heat shock protein Hsp15
MANEVRIDKWLWAARLFKTRSIATEACKKGRITQRGQILKPSHLIKEGDVIEVRKPPIVWSFKVLKPIQNRVGAKLVPEVLENLTPPDQLELLEMSRLAAANQRAKGLGRPTKKDRRDLDSFATEPDWMDWYLGEDEDNDVTPEES